MPQAILAVTPVTETPSAMGLNQVVRAVGFSTGSAVGGLSSPPPPAPVPAAPVAPGWHRLGPGR
jgi:hypothetical protein